VFLEELFFSGRCWLKSNENEKKSWKDSWSICKQLGTAGGLASFRNSNEISFAESFLKTENESSVYWFGLIEEEITESEEGECSCKSQWFSPSYNQTFTGCLIAPNPKLSELKEVENNNLSVGWCVGNENCLKKKKINK